VLLYLWKGSHPDMTTASNPSLSLEPLVQSYSYSVLHTPWSRYESIHGQILGKSLLSHVSHPMSLIHVGSSMWAHPMWAHPMWAHPMWAHPTSLIPCGLIPRLSSHVGSSHVSHPMWAHPTSLIPCGLIPCLSSHVSHPMSLIPCLSSHVSHPM
jgi:hypothetical protein